MLGRDSVGPARQVADGVLRQGAVMVAPDRHLHEAEQESQEWPDLHAAIRAVRKAYQAKRHHGRLEGPGSRRPGSA